LGDVTRLLTRGVDWLKVLGQQTEKPETATGRKVQSPAVPQGIAPGYDAADGSGVFPTRESKGNGEALLGEERVDARIPGRAQGILITVGQEHDDRFRRFRLDGAGGCGPFAGGSDR
jgi:hypothetical protein